VFYAKYQSHEQRCATRPLVHWLVQKTSNENEATPKKRKGARSKDLQWKKRQPSKNAKGLIQKTSDEKRGNPWKTQRGSFKRPLMKKEPTPEKRKGAHSKDLDEKEAISKNAKGFAHSKDLRQKKEAILKNAKGFVQKTFDEQRDNHRKSLVPHRKSTNLHNNLKEVSSQPYWIWVPMFTAAKECVIMHGRVGHWHATGFANQMVEDGDHIVLV
jgi:hypothetical protein